MKKVLLVLMAVALLTSCGKSLSGAGGEVTGVRSVAFNEPSPYGMVLIKRGSFEMGPADKDSLWGINPETKGVSFDAFWMDETEITNAKYRQFVYWVRDSIIRERLADPAYGGNDLFKITEDRYGEPVTRIWTGAARSPGNGRTKMSCAPSKAFTMYTPSPAKNVWTKSRWSTNTNGMTTPVPPCAKTAWTRANAYVTPIYRSI